MRTTFEWACLHLIRHGVAVNIHRGADVCVPHQLLLDGDWRTYSVEPRAVGMPHSVGTDVADSGGRCGLLVRIVDAHRLTTAICQAAPAKQTPNPRPTRIGPSRASFPTPSASRNQWASSSSSRWFLRRRPVDGRCSAGLRASLPASWCRSISALDTRWCGARSRRIHTLSCGTARPVAWRKSETRTSWEDEVAAVVWRHPRPWPAWLGLPESAPCRSTLRSPRWHAPMTG